MKSEFNKKFFKKTAYVLMCIGDNQDNNLFCTSSLYKCVDVTYNFSMAICKYLKANDIIDMKKEGRKNVLTLIAKGKKVYLLLKEIEKRF